MFLKTLMSVLFLFVFLLGCTNKGNAPGGNPIDMPLITTAVSGTSFLSNSVRPQATSGQSLNSQSCSGCGGSTQFLNSWSLGAMFVEQGKFADADSCMVAAVASHELVPGITSGEYKYLDLGQSQMKVKIVLSGTEVTSYELFTCYNGSFLQYVSLTKTGSAATYKFRSNGGGNMFITMQANGTVTGDAWTSKTLDVGFYLGTGPSYSFFNMAQGSDYLDISGGTDAGTLGTLDALDNRLVSRAQLLGSSAKTYAMGDGSVRSASGVGAPSNTNWNGDTGVHGAGPTTYDSAVASATLPTIPTTRVTAFTADETWDCQMSNPANFNALAAANPAFTADAMVCTADFE